MLDGASARAEDNLKDLRHRYRTDERIAAETTAKIEKARNDKLISEYVGKD
ncbi:MULTISPECIES: hypothetical protein [unclassified Mesorhizobium]|uniref:Uncharacterized protein n=1 Tax=Mesorhizobium plurifarium TaxID=69974 RepID=A0A090G416_MESPL|nr:MULTISPECIES: hypothetical protein [unclassified Mesorhizobium]CDX51772.1 hypothetical protein MPL3365_140034 [Mesorhizobium plurifarium]